jgi:hypothetical protein
MRLLSARHFSYEKNQPQPLPLSTLEEGTPSVKQKGEKNEDKHRHPRRIPQMDRRRNQDRKIRQPQPRNTTSNQAAKRGETTMSQPKEIQETTEITKPYIINDELIRAGRSVWYDRSVGIAEAAGSNPAPSTTRSS